MDPVIVMLIILGVLALMVFLRPNPPTHTVIVMPFEPTVNETNAGCFPWIVGAVMLVIIIALMS